LISWPPSLIRELAWRRCIIFVGAGVSASASSTPGGAPLVWKEFLTRSTNLITSNTSKTIAKKLIKANEYLLALQQIKDSADAASFRALLNSTYNSTGIQPSDIHKLIFNLDSKIVITTNFDKIYEQYCNSFANGSSGPYKVIPYTSNDICDELRSDNRLIIKAHGSIDAVNEMIFTRSEYHIARGKYPHFYSVLKALFMTHTLVFLGCGMRDPDILLLLEDVKLDSRSTQPHYAIIKSERGNEPYISDWKNTYNLTTLKYGPTHNSLKDDLEQLVNAVIIERASLGIP
jgi:SIR2-like domain